MFLLTNVTVLEERHCRRLWDRVTYAILTRNLPISLPHIHKRRSTICRLISTI